MPHLAWFSEPSGRIVFVNEPWIAYTGVTLAMLQERVSGVVHPDERELTLAAWHTALTDGQPYEIEYRLRRSSDNSYRWFIARALPMRDAAGAVIGWIGTATDIDDERRTREALEFVLEAEAVFSGSLDVVTIRRNFADIAIKGFADWCFVQLLATPETFSTVASSHRDVNRRHEVEQFIAHSKVRSRGPLIERLRGGSILAPSVSTEQIRAEAEDPEHLAMLLALNLHSVMIVPMNDSEGRLIGAMSLIAAESGRTFSPSDLVVAERITKRAAVAVETARQFERQQRIAERRRLLESVMHHIYDEPALDVTELARRITRAAVPSLADRVALYFGERPGQVQLLAVHDIDPSMIESAFQLFEDYPLAASSALNTVLQHDRPLLVADVNESTLNIFAGDASYLDRLRAIGLRSTLMVPLRGPDRPIGVLSLSMCRDSERRFDEDDSPVVEDLAARTAFALDLAIRHEREYRISQTFQRAALSAELPRIPGTTVSVCYEAGGSETRVGGDWYDAFRLPDGRLVLSIGDVAGSGLDAAIIMGSVRQSIRTAAIINPEPRLVLDAVDRVVRALGERFVTAFVGIFDPLFGDLRYASAGHSAALLRLADGHVEQLGTSGMPLGLRHLAGGETKWQTLPPGSQLLLFTDGLSEIDRDIIAGEERIQAALAGGLETARGLFGKITAGRVAHDDIAIMLVTYERSLLDDGSATAVAHWRFNTADADAGAVLRVALRTFFGRHGLKGARLYHAELISGELIGNAVRYAPGDVEVIVDATGPQPVLHVVDRGPGFELNPRLPADLFSERGRGLYIANELAEELSLSRRIGTAGSHARAVLRTEVRR